MEQVTKQEREIFKDMLLLMKTAKGVGLAANQAGIDKRMLVVDLSDGEGPFYLINPVIIEKCGMAKGEEGCLSLPNTLVNISRAEEVEVTALDENGKFITIKASGLLARVLQHEIDHLNGKLIIDYLRLARKIELIKQFKKMKKTK